MPRILTIFILIFNSFSLLSALTLKNEFENAQPGDFLVFQQERIYTLLHIFAKTDQILTLEEISINESKWQMLSQKPHTTWKTWVKNKAPQNCSWIIYEVNRETGQILRAYSPKKHHFIDAQKELGFLPTLLNLHFTPTLLHERKKISKSFDSEFTPFWQPPVSFEGVKVEGIHFDAFRARWPNDNSPLAGRLIEIYLPSKSSHLPSYFPYWIEVKDPSIKICIPIVDCGKNLCSPASAIP